MELCSRIQLLPVDIINYIKEYVPFITIIFLEKNTYILYHDYIVYKILGKIEKYIRFIIRNDFEFVLNQMMHTYYKKWINQQKYLYKDTIYYNYLSFILFFITENNSNKCKRLLNDHLKKHGISKNLYKNNTFINKRWKL